MKINIITFIILLASFNCLLLSQDENTSGKINNESQVNTQKRPRLKITPLYNENENNFEQIPANADNNPTSNSRQPQAPSQELTLIKPTEWILKASFQNAPDLLKGIFFYLQSLLHCKNTLEYNAALIPSFHRFILVGPPGTGKTTLAHAIAHVLGYSIAFTPATGLLGHFRNQTAVNIQKFFSEHTSDGLNKVIIIDELHKLFEHHENDHADHSQSAAAFWLVLDNIEKCHPNVIFIATANNVEKLPPEIKSRFAGKVITMPLPNKDQKMQIFKDSIAHDQSVAIDDSISDAFIAQMIQQISNGSIRDIRLIIDTAKIFYYTERFECDPEVSIVTLTKSHFQQALNQLQAESKILQKSTLERLHEQLQRWGLIFSIGANIVMITKASTDLLGSNLLKKISGFFEQIYPLNTQKIIKQ